VSQLGRKPQAHFLAFAQLVVNRPVVRISRADLWADCLSAPYFKMLDGDTHADGNLELPEFVGFSIQSLPDSDQLRIFAEVSRRLSNLTQNMRYRRVLFVKRSQFSIVASLTTDQSRHLIRYYGTFKEIFIGKQLKFFANPAFYSVLSFYS
jgi:hypothetical protein